MPTRTGVPAAPEYGLHVCTRSNFSLLPQILDRLQLCTWSTAVWYPQLVSGFFYRQSYTNTIQILTFPDSQIRPCTQLYLPTAVPWRMGRTTTKFSSCIPVVRRY
eukprot:SAG31_NODE_905_length_11119_cov_2.887931_16_plen_105_part_00